MKGKGAILAVVAVFLAAALCLKLALPNKEGIVKNADLEVFWSTQVNFGSMTVKGMVVDHQFDPASDASLAFETSSGLVPVPVDGAGRFRVHLGEPELQKLLLEKTTMPLKLEADKQGLFLMVRKRR